MELFTGPGVTDAARADLKKEMTKKGVRKNIVDNVLAKLVAGGANGSGGVQSDGSENGDTGVSANSAGAKKEYIPPSLALQGRKPTGGSGASNGASGMSRTVSQGNVRELSRPASRTATVSPSLPPTPTDNSGNDVHPVYVSLIHVTAGSQLINIQITSTRDLENEFAAMLKPFDVCLIDFIPNYHSFFFPLQLQGKETEHNWADREKAILRVRGMLKGDVHTRYIDTFLACLKEGYIKWSLKAVSMRRTINFSPLTYLFLLAGQFANDSVC